VFDLDQEDLVDEVSWAALAGKAFPLSQSDHLILCSAEWLTVIANVISHFSTSRQWASCSVGGNTVTGLVDIFSAGSYCAVTAGLLCGITEDFSSLSAAVAMTAGCG
jgi:hypothetical protein